MTNFVKLSALVLGTTALTLTAFSTVASAHPKGQHAEKPANHQKMEGEHKDMKKTKHGMKSNVDMSKLSADCQAMVTKMQEEKVAHGEDSMKGHGSMSKAEGHDMSAMKDQGSDEMKALMDTHKKCMAEIKEAKSSKY